jgi:hypothetical protein
MSNINNIIQPVLNGRTRESRKFSYEQKGIAVLTIAVNADRDLTLNLYQSYNGENFDKVNTASYLATDGNKLFSFDKEGEIFYFELVNNSGTDCTYTRAFADFIYVEASSSSVSSEVSDPQTHSGLSNVVAVLQAGISVNNTDFAFLSDINTTLNTGLNTSDSTTHNKLEIIANETETIRQFLQTETVNVEDISVRNRLEEINSNVNVINTTLNAGINVDVGNNVDIRNLNKNQDKVEVYPGTENLNVDDAVSQGLLSNIDVKLNNGVVDTCSKLCRPLLVKSQFINAAGANAVNLIDGPFKLVSFIYAHADSQGCLTFYDENAAATPPTVANTPVFSVGSTTATLAAPSFPTSTYINFNNGLWLRLSSNLDPTNTANDAGTVTIFYET